MKNTGPTFDALKACDIATCRCTRVETGDGETARAAIATFVAAAAATWYDATVDVRPSPQQQDAAVLGHALACACQLAAFAAVVYALSSRGGTGDRSGVVCPRRPHDLCDGPLSDPGGGVYDDDDDGDCGLSSAADAVRGSAKCRRRRKVKSAAPLLQR